MVFSVTVDGVSLHAHTVVCVCVSVMDWSDVCRDTDRGDNRPLFFILSLFPSVSKSIMGNEVTSLPGLPSCASVMRSFCVVVTVRQGHVETDAGDVDFGL